jgi:hypothetical protein
MLPMPMSPSGKEFYMINDGVANGQLYNNTDKPPPVPQAGFGYVWEYAGYRNKDGTITPGARSPISLLVPINRTHSTCGEFLWTSGTGLQVAPHAQPRPKTCSTGHGRVVGAGGKARRARRGRTSTLDP